MTAGAAVLMWLPVFEWVIVFGRGLSTGLLENAAIADFTCCSAAAQLGLFFTGTLNARS